MKNQKHQESTKEKSMKHGQNRGWFLLVGLLLLVSITPSASADLRLWEQGEEEDSEEQHRFFDVNAFTQMGYYFALTDETFGQDVGREGNGFLLQRARLGFHAKVYDWLLLRTEVDFAGANVALQDAFIDMPFLDEFRIRAGQMNIPFLNAYRFNEVNLAFIDRPLYTPISPFRSYIEFLSARDFGGMVSGLIGNTETGNTLPVFEYNFGVFLGEGPNSIVGKENLLYTIKLRLHALGLPLGDHAENDLAYNPTPKVAVGFGLYSNCKVQVDDWNRGFTVDTEVRWKGLYGSASFLWVRNGQGSGALAKALGYDQCAGSGAQGVDDNGNPRDSITRGAHLQVQYILPKLIFPFEGMDLEVLSRFDWVDPSSPYDSGNPLFGGNTGSASYVPPENFGDARNGPTRYRMTFGVNYFPTGQNDIRVQVNYQLNRELEDIATSQGPLQGLKNDILWLQLTAGI